MADYTEAVSFLQKASAKTGGTVYDTLASMVDKILEERPADAVDLLETCLLVKKTAFTPVDTVGAGAATAKDTAAAVALNELYIAPEAPINEETGEPEELPAVNDFETENMVADASLFAAVGAGLGQTEMYKVMMAAKKLGEDAEKELATVRFFGKIFGTGGDYYVFESTLKSPPAAPEPEEGADLSIAPPEFGSGTNAWTYFVCSYLGGPFTMLPDVTPQQVTAARQLKKFMTGDLSAEVSAYPVFPGTEASFLRAQIARIAAATVLCPSGFFSVGEDGVSLEKVEEFTPAAASELSWCHRYQHVKAQGRCELYVPPPPEGEEEAPPAEEPEVSPALLTAIADDARIGASEEVEGEPAWATLSSSAQTATKYQTAGVRSTIWSGAVAVASGALFSNMYVGWGVKNAPFVPTPPPAPAAEAEPLVESTELPPIPDPEPEEEAAEE